MESIYWVGIAGPLYILWLNFESPKQYLKIFRKLSPISLTYPQLFPSYPHNSHSGLV
jgi:hypothetical protein